MTKTRDEAREWLEQTDDMIRLVDKDMQTFRESLGKLARSYGRGRELVRLLLDELDAYDKGS